MSSNGDEQFVLRDEAVSWVPAENDSVVVLDLRSSRYLNLNAAAAVLWTRVAQGASADGLVSALVDRFGIAADRADRDVAAFLEDLRTRDLLLVAD